MVFLRLEEAGPLEIRYKGEPLDLYAFGIFHLNMQDIVDKVALGLLSQAGLLEPTWRRASYLPRRPFLSYPRLVRAEINQISVGSLSEGILFAVAVALADPNVIAVLQNLAANVVWAIGASGVRGIRRRVLEPPNNYRWYHRDDDPVEVGPNLRDVIIALAQHNEGHRSELTIRSGSPNRGQTEVTIVIDGQ